MTGVKMILDVRNNIHKQNLRSLDALYATGDMKTDRHEERQTWEVHRVASKLKMIKLLNHGEDIQSQSDFSFYYLIFSII